jgi:hypothetical protein
MPDTTDNEAKATPKLAASEEAESPDSAQQVPTSGPVQPIQAPEEVAAEFLSSAGASQTIPTAPAGVPLAAALLRWNEAETASGGPVHLAPSESSLRSLPAVPMPSYQQSKLYKDYQQKLATETAPDKPGVGSPETSAVQETSAPPTGLLATEAVPETSSSPAVLVGRSAPPPTPSSTPVTAGLAVEPPTAEMAAATLDPAPATTSTERRSPGPIALRPIHPTRVVPGTSGEPLEADWMRACGMLPRLANTAAAATPSSSIASSPDLMMMDINTFRRRRAAARVGGEDGADTGSTEETVADSSDAGEKSEHYSADDEA